MPRKKTAHAKRLAHLSSLIQSGELAKAEEACAQARREHPHDPGVLSAAARLYWLRGDRDQAVQAGEEAIRASRHKNPDLIANHARTLYDMRRFGESLSWVESGLQRHNGHPRLLELHAALLVKRSRRTEAREILDRLIAQEPTPGRLDLLGQILFDMGEPVEGLNRMAEAHRQDPANITLHNNYIFYSHYMPELDARALQARLVEWYQHRIAHLPVTERFDRNRDPERPLRIGFISNGFRMHPAGTLSLGPIMMLSRYFQHEIYLYSTSPESSADEITRSFKNEADNWQVVHGLSDRALHEKLLGNELDILIEMTGPTGNSALLAVARRAAPVQIKWVGGLFNTSVVPAIDYLLTDWMENPEGSEKTFMEKLIRLPSGYVTYRPPSYLPRVNSLPALENGYVTFGCLNKTHKINPVIAGVWAGILREVPNSRILLT